MHCPPLPFLPSRTAKDGCPPESSFASGEDQVIENDICDTHVQSLVQALWLRDPRIEEHTQRVTAMALALAHLWGLSKEQSLPIRRGALLHDVGKIGIPDAILHKNGVLTPEEQEVMRMHPVYAYELLRGVPYLRAALEIPYCHHEKWDGTGYPRGLKGSQIPFGARLFAVVDVWDALLSDRPYRPAWTKRQTMAYIRVEAGKHFDPEVVRMFGVLLGGLNTFRDAKPLPMMISHARVHAGFAG